MEYRPIRDRIGDKLLHNNLSIKIENEEQYNKLLIEFIDDYLGRLITPANAQYQVLIAAEILELFGTLLFFLQLPWDKVEYTLSELNTRLGSYKKRYASDYVGPLPEDNNGKEA